MIYAVEGSCFVLAPCSLVTKEMQDMLCEGNPEKEALFRLAADTPQSSALTDPKSPERIPHDQEGILYADIDLHMIGYAKAAADPAATMPSATAPAF